MALKSMTGFGRGEAASRGLRVEIELSSVNRKQLDVRVNLPRALGALESRIFKEIGKSFSRGCVTGSVTVAASSGSHRKAQVDHELAADYIVDLRKTAAELGLQDDLSARAILQLPEVVRVGHPEADATTVGPVVSKALKQALADLTVMRKKEGQALRDDIAHRLELMRSRLDRIAKMSPKVVARYRKALMERLSNSRIEISKKDPDLIKGLALFADRSDISEEVTRLDSHLKQAFGLLSSSKPVGRTLDFLAQEMFREINTIGSKANDAGISRHVVSFKTELERTREQAQNVE